MLESKHVIGLFFVMLLFSGVFFSLGFVMGRNQYDGQVRAAGNGRATTEVPAARDHSAAASHNEGASTDPAAQPSGDWGDFYDAGNSKPVDDHLKAPAARTVPAAAHPVAAKPSRSLNAPLIPGGSYTLQVAALRRQADALALANSLQKKKFPAFVLTPQGDRYFRVQVGPYPEQKAAEAAKKGLEGAGFKAIVKH